MGGAGGGSGRAGASNDTESECRAVKITTIPH